MVGIFLWHQNVERQRPRRWVWKEDLWVCSWATGKHQDSGCALFPNESSVQGVSTALGASLRHWG